MSEEQEKHHGTLRYIITQCQQALDGKQDARTVLKVVQMNASNQLSMTDEVREAMRQASTYGDD